MKNVVKILIITGIIFGLLNIQSVWREYKYQQVVTTAKANVLSVEINPFSGKALASIQYKVKPLFLIIFTLITMLFTKRSIDFRFSSICYFVML